MYKKYEIGNVYYDNVRGKYYIIIGYKSFEDDFYEQIFFSAFRQMSGISPYIYKEPDIVIKDWVERTVSYAVYETNKKDFLNEKINIQKVRTIPLAQLKQLLTERTYSKYYKKISKADLDTWVLKNKLINHLANNITTDINLLCTSVKNVFLQINIPKDIYIRMYKDYHFKPMSSTNTKGKKKVSVTDLKDKKYAKLVVIKGYKKNHVFLVTEQNKVSPKIALTGYLLQTFKKSELLEMINYLNMNGRTYTRIAKTRDRVEKQGKQQEIRVVDDTRVVGWQP